MDAVNVAFKILVVGDSKKRSENFIIRYKKKKRKNLLGSLPVSKCGDDVFDFVSRLVENYFEYARRYIYVFDKQHKLHVVLLIVMRQFFDTQINRVEEIFFEVLRFVSASEKFG